MTKKYTTNKKLYSYTPWRRRYAWLPTQIHITGQWIWLRYYSQRGCWPKDFMGYFLIQREIYD